MDPISEATRDEADKLQDYLASNEIQDALNRLKTLSPDSADEMQRAWQNGGVAVVLSDKFGLGKRTKPKEGKDEGTTYALYDPDDKTIYVAREGLFHRDGSLNEQEATSRVGHEAGHWLHDAFGVTLNQCGGCLDYLNTVWDVGAAQGKGDLRNLRDQRWEGYAAQVLALGSRDGNSFVSFAYPGQLVVAPLPR